MKKEILFLNSSEVVFIYKTVNNFMSYNPPCQTCLIQGMCLSNVSYSNNDFICIKIKKCKKLINFINSNKFFRSIIPQKRNKDNG